MDYDAYDALLHHIFKQTQGDAWFKPSEENIHAGVCLRVDAGTFRVFPYENPWLEPFEAAVRVLNPVVAVKMRSAAVHAALGTVKEGRRRFLWMGIRGYRFWTRWCFCRVRIRSSVGFYPRRTGARHLVIQPRQHHPDVSRLRGQAHQARVNQRSAFTSLAGSIAPSTIGSDVNLTEKTKEVISEKEVVVKDKTMKKKKRNCGLSYWISDGNDVEKTAEGPSLRPTRLLAPVYSGLGAALSLFFIGNGVSVLLEESLLDGSWSRFALLVTVPFLFCVSLFFSLMIVTNVTYVLGPVAQFHENSKYYSAVPPAPNKLVDANLPHITVEMPVYKESLKETIAPSVYSLKKAMQTYARQGGTSSIFVHDDGLQLIGEEERQERIAFYADHNIGWKASNMNYGLALSLKLERNLLALEAEAASRSSVGDGLEEENLEDRAMEMAVEEIYEESGRRWKPWACNGKSLRMGELILIVDSDTIVPEDCFRDAARELAECPEVDHPARVGRDAGGVPLLRERDHAFYAADQPVHLDVLREREVAPFVGHNAFLRWSALQDAAFVDEADGVRKIWSEANVSEDFDMALRLMLRGYIIRWATYSNRGFKEGVSLTCDDELNRWQKYSYGCNELIFNPLIYWFRKGPVTKQLRTFMWSAAPLHYKIGMMSYMFSYYALAGAAILSAMNYFLLGWNIGIDDYYEHSFEIWLACTVVFPGPVTFFFFGGLSIHLSQALLAHLFSYNITWGATKKEVERSNFWLEVPKILKRFWISLVISFAFIAAMVLLSTDVVPIGWRIFGGLGGDRPACDRGWVPYLVPDSAQPVFMIFSY
ncbi:hypothetical protein A0H81_07226 [Grifola frondosa]|uniref:Uncharacterized protein n=1 Tax=Grifola frondosa TaxID=5627 RepID=A0A1C7M7S2_GRIFR|nr:hypothetical protein A0H81_07226 [Grifola frondosa]